MKIKIIAIGKVKEKYYKEALAEYVKRLSRYTKTEITEIDEILCDNELEKEAKEILSKLGGYIIVLDKDGENLSSEKFAEKIDKIKNTASEITFVIGGSIGLCESVKKKADFVLSFGAETLPHSLARVLLTEQIYRAFNILEGGKYHK
ncbi:MAG TPA: 23S rRNA (pseudouridine(1915)-N(3))-methyltransferase RlmH [Clostridia bacterium]|nr:23S rRNA (pseudouridine(1915)-N(3))-methyltransferase RlmH [Clostridia bacterium]